MLDQLVLLVYKLFVFVLLVRCVLSWIRPVHYHPLVRALDDLTAPITEPVLAPIRRLLPPWKTGGLDFSPMIAIFLAYIAVQVLVAILP